MKKFLLFLWLFLISNTITNSKTQNVQMVHGNLEDEVIHSVMEIGRAHV